MRILCYLFLIIFFISFGTLTFEKFSSSPESSSVANLENKGTVMATGQGISTEMEKNIVQKNKRVEGDKVSKTAKSIDDYVQWAIMVADNNIHGYSQGSENATTSHPYTGSREGPDFDCASLIYHALDHAGFPIIAAWQKNPAYYNLYHGKQATGDADTIWTDLKRVGGFAKYSWESVKNDLHRGDILCNPEVHVAIYIGDGKTVEARGVNNPRGGAWRTGDQGGEIDYYNAQERGWKEVYRYVGK